jgi:hypothetical protein
MVVCIFGRVQWRWALSGRLARGYLAGLSAGAVSVAMPTAAYDSSSMICAGAAPPLID